MILMLSEGENIVPLSLDQKLMQLSPEQEDMLAFALRKEWIFLGLAFFPKKSEVTPKQKRAALRKYYKADTNTKVQMLYFAQELKDLMQSLRGNFNINPPQVPGDSASTFAWKEAWKDQFAYVFNEDVPTGIARRVKKLVAGLLKNKNADAKTLIAIKAKWERKIGMALTIGIDGYKKEFDKATYQHASFVISENSKNEGMKQSLLEGIGDFNQSVLLGVNRASQAIRVTMLQATEQFFTENLLPKNREEYVAQREQPVLGQQKPEQEDGEPPREKVPLQHTVAPKHTPPQSVTEIGSELPTSFGEPKLRKYK